MAKTCKTGYLSTNSRMYFCEDHFDQSQNPARHCLDLESLIKIDNEKKAILDKINSRRNKVAAGEIRSFPSSDNMLKLEWNTKLEKSAQRWANQCVINSTPDIKDACRDIEGKNVGQSIATVYGESPGLLPTALVDLWYMELLNVNGSILPRFQESSDAGPHYDYFTQLVWSDTSEVGCGGVKFKERLENQDGEKNRTVYRLVCNFAPSGNRENQSVYSIGAPCSKCPNGAACDITYSALCSRPAKRNVQEASNKTKDVNNSPNNFQEDQNVEFPTRNNTTKSDEVLNISETESDVDGYTPFDYFSHLHEFTRQSITGTTPKKQECKDVLAVDDFIELLRKKLSNDHMFKDMLLATKTTQVIDNNFTDPSVAAFVNKIYSKKEPSTTAKSTENELLNSTLLVDLVEAVIFRSGDKIPASEVVEQTTQSMSDISPVKIQAELAQIQQNDDFTGHYFFPEDDEEGSTKETTESYYDGSNLSIADVIMEIEDIKKSTITKNFLDDILELESSIETTTNAIIMSPDDMNAHKSGHEVMKKFLDDIKDKSGG